MSMFFFGGEIFPPNLTVLANRPEFPNVSLKKRMTEDKENIILLPVDSGERDLENRAFLPPEVVMVSSIYYRIYLLS